MHFSSQRQALKSESEQLGLSTKNCKRANSETSNVMCCVASRFIEFRAWQMLKIYFLYIACGHALSVTMVFVATAHLLPF